jgi:hypothetical protein
VTKNIIKITGTITIAIAESRSTILIVPATLLRVFQNIIGVADPVELICRVRIIGTFVGMRCQSLLSIGTPKVSFTYIRRKPEIIIQCGVIQTLA